MELRHLRAFKALMHAGSTVGAAAALGISQPSVSRLLAELEVTLGEPLFTRANGRLSPRPKAELLLPDVERALGGVEALIDTDGGSGAPLRLAAPAGVISSIFSLAAQRFLAERSNFRINAEIMS